VEAPEQPSSRPREELGDGIRSLHVRVAASRRSSAAHIVYYLRGRLDDGTEGIIVARILHEHMDPFRHISPADE
jgi:toxin ParE1/3/4